MANRYWKKVNNTNEDLIEVDLVSESVDPIVYQKVFEIKPTMSLNEIEHTDLIIVAALDGNMDKEIKRNASYIPWIKHQRIANNAEVASLCKGAFLLAETGLLNGKDCSTHWTVHNQFRQRYPKVNLIPEQIISEQNGIYSSGGAYSFLNFIIYLIERLFGRETAIWCSKLSEIDFDREDQSPFIIFNGQKDHGDKTILKAQQHIELNYAEPITITNLAEDCNMSERTFLRRFKKATFNSPLHYIQRVKIEAAKRKLETTSMQIQEVMFDVGYSDNNAFRQVFKKYSGVTPQEYQRKYNVEVAKSVA
jgi:transcriptional regulator GlxA family with amidase domain